LLQRSVFRCLSACAQDRAFNDRRYYIGNSKLHSLGWQERTTWDEGLRKTIDWWVHICHIPVL
jgi:UDP-glucose 4,6-dehydratase